jgi:hypothetical protein
MNRTKGYDISRWKNGRFWSLTDARGELVCVCVYKKGASEVKRILEERGECVQEREAVHAAAD